MKKSGYLAKQREISAKQSGIHTQMCLDAAMLAANDVFNMGPKRAPAFCAAFSQAITEIATMTANDTKDLGYTKTKLDNRLRKICGENFKPWEERYARWR